MSCEKERNQPATIVRDCTGTYLQIDSKDYQVCNVSKTETFEADELVIATFKIVGECIDPDYVNPDCKMLHHFEDWIEVQKIKKK